MLAFSPVRRGLCAWDEDAEPVAFRAVPRPMPPLSLVTEAPPRDLGPAICLEQAWRELPRDKKGSHILVGRWREESLDVRRHSSEGNPDYAIVAIAMRSTIVMLKVDGRCVHDGRMAEGTAVLTSPASRSDAEFSGACDFIHLFVPTRRLLEIAREAGVEAGAGTGDPKVIVSTDPVIERLAWLLPKASDHEGIASDVFLDGIATAIVTRMFSHSLAKDLPSSRRGLVKWRLKRVQELIEAQLSEPLSLRDLARSAGLSRMHFAAQFRAATGMRPHEYLIRRRIQRAQEMLLTTSVPLVEVALSVGFQTQAHFTTVFRRLLGETPGRWRQAQRFG